MKRGLINNGVNIRNRREKKAQRGVERAEDGSRWEWDEKKAISNLPLIAFLCLLSAFLTLLTKRSERCM